MQTQAPTLSQAPPRRERRKEARPRELLDAALDLFVEKGFAATRAEEIAARAGVSKGTLFLYFPTKQDVFKAVIRENIVSQFPAWQQEFEQYQGSSVEMLRHTMLIWWERIGKTRASGIVKLVMSEAQNFPEVAAYYQREVIQPGNALLRQILARGVARGEFRALDLDHAIYTLTAPMIFLMMWKHSIGACAQGGGIRDPEDFLRVQVDVLLNGLLAPAQS